LQLHQQLKLHQRGGVLSGEESFANTLAGSTRLGEEAVPYQQMIARKKSMSNQNFLYKGFF
jgi:hypothetical protein